MLTPNSTIPSLLKPQSFSSALLQVNQLKLNLDKTELMLVGRLFDMGENGIPIIEGVQPPLVSLVRSLGVPLGPLLHLALQVVAVARNDFHQLHLMRRL